MNPALSGGISPYAIDTTAHNAAMNADLDPVIAALADLGDAEFHALIAATYGVPQTAPGAMQIADSFGQKLVLSFSSFERNP